jgi:hypothetical protein
MFPDSAIAREMTVGANKSSYVVRFALGPYFKSELDADIDTSAFSIQFDETTTHQIIKQMDVLVRYYSKGADRAVVRYLDSLQFGHAPAQKVVPELLRILQEHGMDLSRLVTCGRDGPNVNKAIMRLLNNELDGRKMIDLGPCVLHTVHNGFASGLQEMPEIEDFIIDLHYWFNTSYGACRREDYKIVQIQESVDSNSCSIETWDH